jgi:hypothetical protein
MNIIDIATIPESLHDKTRAALAATFGSKPITVTGPVRGGASGALAFHLHVAARDYVLRLEGPRTPFRNPYQYLCLRSAADAGIAPLVHHADDANGVLIMDFIRSRPLTEYPGGPVSLAAALGALARQLQDTAPFPALGDYRDFIARMLGRLGTRCAPGLLDAHIEGFAQIRELCPWSAATHVSAHNDPNPRNILFDGERLWLIDWETAYRNDRLVDVAILAENFGASPELETALLQSWMPLAPDADMRKRLVLVRLMTRAYYASLLSALSINSQPVLQDLAAPTPEQFKTMLASGQLKPADTGLTLAKMLLASFRAGIESREVQTILASYS